jgi:voltage-gated potassium channel
MYSKTITQVKFGLAIILITLLIGIGGYMLIENLTFLDAFYMTIITISTTGFAEVKPLSQFGRLLTVVLIITGVSALAYTGGKTAQAVIESQVFRRRRMSKKLNELKDHYIVCGYGRMGRQICEGLIANNSPFVVVENDSAKIDMLIDKDLLYVKGDATNDEVLLTAGLKKAKGLVAVIRTDAENVFATLSAKELNPEIFVVARAVDEGTESKLTKAGANRVVLPYELGGNRMVQLLLRPGVMDFIDGVARNKEVDIGLEEIHVEASSVLTGKTLVESPIRKELNIIIAAISRKDGQFIYNPQSRTVIEAGDKLIAIGETENLAKLTKLCV